MYGVVSSDPTDLHVAQQSEVRGLRCGGPDRGEVKNFTDHAQRQTNLSSGPTYMYRYEAHHVQQQRTTRRSR